MQFRYARHSNNLAALEKFYTEIIGLEKLGEFRDHVGYNGIFLGLKGQSWHLEFTDSEEPAVHQPDADDLLVFYFSSDMEIENIIKKAALAGFSTIKSKNPYWVKNGFCLLDPDGFGVMLSRYEQLLSSGDALTQLALSSGIKDWNSLLTRVKQLPYSRNADRADFSLVWKEQRGTCSSKHAFLKKIADLNKIENIHLILGIYKMQAHNTPGIGNILSDNGLDYIPEAHCYLKIGNHRYDLTSAHSDISRLEAAILEEQKIEAAQVVDFKVDCHKKFLAKWLAEEKLNMDLETIWAIRERCIENLS